MYPQDVYPVAQVQISDNNYQVDMQYDAAPYKVNDPRIDFGNIHSEIGGFGASHYPTDGQANVSARKNSDYVYRLSGHIKFVQLGHGITGTVYQGPNSVNNYGGLTWTEGHWLIQIEPGDVPGDASLGKPSNMAMAKYLIEYFSQHPLPTVGKGIYVVINNMTLLTSFAQWSSGRTVYNCWTIDDPTGALRMAESM